MDIYNAPSRVVKHLFFLKNSKYQPLNTILPIPSFGMVVAFLGFLLHVFCPILPCPCTMPVRRSYFDRVVVVTRMLYHGTSYA